MRGGSSVMEVEAGKETSLFLRPGFCCNSSCKQLDSLKK